MDSSRSQVSATTSTVAQGTYCIDHDLDQSPLAADHFGDDMPAFAECPFRDQTSDGIHWCLEDGREIIINIAGKV